MLSPTSQDNGPLKEWSPLTSLLQKIPLKIHVGLFTQDLNLTCIDVVSEFVALGTNHGIIYWFNRKSEKLETLKCENCNSSITCVQIVSTVDFMVAAGNNQGVVTIFQIPKEIPHSIPEILKPKKKNQVERFSISDLHKVSVAAVEWSKNGMKLFSGDENGLVVLTEMDFNLRLSKSTELLNEKYSVVQLSYQSGLLLISTLFRTILVDKNQNYQVTQVGQKERKILGKFGAVFMKNKIQVQEPIIYASRPGLRIWQADNNGIVLKTLILKDAVKLEANRVELLNPITSSLKYKSQADSSFGIILPFTDDLLVTFNQDIIYIIHPITITIVTVITDLRKITDISCSDDEIFILEGKRNIVRIASYPDINNSPTGLSNPNELEATLTESFNHLTWGISELTSKLKSSPIVPALNKIKPTDFIHSSSILPSIINGLEINSIINAEEAVEIPPIIPLDLNTHLVTGINILKIQSNSTEDETKITNRKDIFQKIGEQDFEEVLFKPKKKNDKSQNHTVSINSREESEICNHDDDINVCRSNIQNFSDNLFQPILNEKNLNTIEKAVQDKEKLLSNYLDLDLAKYKDKYKKICTMKSNSYLTCSKNQTNPCVIDTNKSLQRIELVNNKNDQHLDELLKSSNSINCNQTTSETHFRNQQPQNSKTNLEDNMSEIHFNALSKEFVKSTTYQDNDDWILLG